MAKPVEPTGLPLVDGLALLSPPTIEDYCRASAEYIRQASVLGSAKGKAAQIRLSNALAAITLVDLRSAGLALPAAGACAYPWRRAQAMLCRQSPGTPRRALRLSNGPTMRCQDGVRPDGADAA